VSAPAFQVLKTSTDLTGDPAVLLAGEKLRYTITIRNVGNADATDAVLRDQIPVNTTYVAGSTRLNGTLVPDNGALSPLVSGLSIHAAGDATPGSIPADAPSAPGNVATITFDVIVDPTVIDGTIISNQGYVSAIDGGIVDYPSDDPATPIANDPTRDVVGNLPLLYADKRVVLYVDQSSPGVVDPGDVLRYTITVQNSAAIPATAVVLRDGRTGEHDLCRRLDSAQRLARPPARWRRCTARRGSRLELQRSHAAAARRGCRHDFRRLVRGTAVRPARERWRTGRDADQQPGGGLQRGAT
jgi:uncharacterized repeat protein (TIGR01451 family)